MICCDHCNEWYHGNCVGITSNLGQKMIDADEEYVCPSCSSNTTSVSSISVGPHTSSVIHSCEPCVDFQWGDSDGKTFCELIRDAFEVVVHWRCNNFLVPSGKAGNNFVLELARLYQAYADNSALHSIALTTCCVFQVLLLQKPHAKSKSRDYVHCLEHRLDLWYRGDITALVKEGKCIQDHLHSTTQKGPKSNNVARNFDQLMSSGRVTAALKFLSTDARGILPLHSKISYRPDAWQW